MKSRAGDVLNGKYEVERQLAKGGMGSVWTARDLKLGRRVAVKFIEIVPTGASDAAAIRARFEREAMAVARLSTPHVVQIFDHALDSDTPYIVMECLEGEDLKQRLGREHRLTFPAAVAIMNQAARGLRAAHEAGIIHRDLKPANVFLAEVDHEQVVKILDFGIAKLLDHRAVTVDGEIFGSAKYMSPEQITGAKDLDLRSDLWSMGVILYRMITGSDPFTGDIVQTVQSLRLGDYALASATAPDLVPEVDAFFARALAVDKKRRFFSAVEMAEAFADLAEKQAAVTGGGFVAPTDTTKKRSPIATVRQTVQPAEPEPQQTTRIDHVAPPQPEPQQTTRVEGVAAPFHFEDLAAPPPSRDLETLSITMREGAPARQPMRHRVSWVALAVLGLIAAILALRTKSAPVVAGDPPSPAAQPVAPPPSPQAAPPPVPEAAREAAESAEPSSDPPPADSDDGAAASGFAAPFATGRRTAKPNCNPAYEVDSQGIRHPIKGCY